MKRLSLILALAGVLATVVGCDAPAPTPTPSLYPAPTPDTKFEKIKDFNIEHYGRSKRPFCNCGQCRELAITPFDQIARTTISMSLPHEQTDTSYYFWIESLSDQHRVSIMCPFYDYASQHDFTYTYYQNKYMFLYAYNSTSPPFTHIIEDLCIHIPAQLIETKSGVRFVIKIHSRLTGKYYTSPEITMTYEDTDNQIYPVFIGE